MNILQKIVETKKQEIILQKLKESEEQLMTGTRFTRSSNSLKTKLLSGESSGIIAEFKQKSPSKGVINESATVEDVTRGYVAAGVAGLSVLTDQNFFGGSLNNLERARTANPGIPILRKDFMIDPYQIIQAKAYGADVILLIASILEKEQAEMLAQKAKELGLEVLMEVHDSGELKMINQYIDFVGVNNRNLKTFSVDIETSVQLADHIPAGLLKISESGIADPQTIRHLKTHGFNGFLIGETFMKERDPGAACKKLIKELSE